MQLVFPSRKYVILLTVLWAVGLGAMPWLFFVVLPPPDTGNDIFFVYLVADSAVILFVPISYVLLGVAEKIHRASGHVKMTYRVLFWIWLLGFPVLLFGMGLIWTYLGYTSGSPITVLVALATSAGAAVLAVPLTKRIVTALLENNEH